ncbi:MAG: bifunctional nuclease family protein [Candidatus Marinimicrobia bacterium]|nr:bifunctional nuclease family protein [Candidatus Neomarinimicrobiota bacterium]
MENLRVEIAKISFYPPSKGYAVLLKELNGVRQLPVIVGAFEAQAIALAIEGIEMPRPMTHDLLSNLLDTMEVEVKEIVIDKLVEGTFYAKIYIDSYQFGEKEIDSRPSDAIALALRVDAPVFVEKKVMKEAGVRVSDQKEFDEFKIDSPLVHKEFSLEEELQQAIEVENYELAAELRDKINALNGDGGEN